MTKREKILRAMKAAGAANDKAAFTFLYVSNKISLKAANAAWAEGVRLARFCTIRDAQANLNNKA